MTKARGSSEPVNLWLDYGCGLSAVVIRLAVERWPRRDDGARGIVRGPGGDAGGEGEGRKQAPDAVASARSAGTATGRPGQLGCWRSSGVGGMDICGST